MECSISFAAATFPQAFQKGRTNRGKCLLKNNFNHTFKSIVSTLPIGCGNSHYSLCHFRLCPNNEEGTVYRIVYAHGLNDSSSTFPDVWSIHQKHESIFLMDLAKKV